MRETLAEIAVKLKILKKDDVANLISYIIGSNKFQFRAASILLLNNKVLLQRQSNDNVWFIPGGRVEFDETAEHIKSCIL